MRSIHPTRAPDVVARTSELPLADLLRQPVYTRMVGFERTVKRTEALPLVDA